MTARDITARLLVDRYRRSLCIPRYTPARWWECDVFEVTAAGYAREYEVKVSLGDFRADAEKGVAAVWYGHDRRVLGAAAGLSKHQRLAAADPHGPGRFWFVLPQPLAESVRSSLPPWAGLIACAERAGVRRPWRVTTRELVPAPRLHGGKADPAVVAHARGVCYWRYLKAVVFASNAAHAEH